MLPRSETTVVEVVAVVVADEDEIYLNTVCEPEEVHIPYTEPLTARLLEQIRQRLKVWGCVSSQILCKNIETVLVYLQREVN